MKGIKDITVVGSDAHAPHHNPKHINLFCDVIKFLKPKRVVLPGDWFDCNQISRWPKNPEYDTKWQEELNEGIDLLDQVGRAAGKKAEKVFIDGNHEDRIRKWLWEHREVSSLDALSPRNLFALDRLKWQYVPYDSEYRINKFRVTHGHIVRQFSSYSARGMLDKYKTSGCSGHTHRMGFFKQRYDDVFHHWYEIGCLCKADRTTYDPCPDWHGGFAVLYSLEGEEKVYTDLLEIEDNRIVYNGRLFE
jgi:predicted phosphodiesterase